MLSDDEEDVYGDLPKRSKRGGCMLSSRKEDSVAEWIADNPMFYNKKLNEYRNKSVKDRRWIKKAKEVGLTYAELHIWFKSMRTRFGKLVKMNKSGDGAKEHTERDKWILKAFNFLRTHIVTVRSVQPLSVSVMYSVCLLLL